MTAPPLRDQQSTYRQACCSDPIIQRAWGGRLAIAPASDGNPSALELDKERRHAGVAYDVLTVRTLVDRDASAFAGCRGAPAIVERGVFGIVTTLFVRSIH